jgi:adenylate cyclase
VQQTRTERRLAAILVADVVGYSRLIGQDETGTLTRIKTARREVVDPNIRACRGRVVKTAGDSMLIEFPSAVEAVRCAVAVQRAMAERNAEMSADQRIDFRVGINVGDIVVDNQDIFGDGVNVAARLQALSDPGGICISSRIYEDLAGRLALPFEDRGDQEVKNIARPVRVYDLSREVIAQLPPLPRSENGQSPTRFFERFRAFAFACVRMKKAWAGAVFVALAAIGILVWQLIERDNARGRASAGLSGEVQRPGPALAVLPFDNLSGDPSQDFVSDGISEQLITVLSNYDDLRVLARNTTFAYKKKALDVVELGRQLRVQYVIEGSFRRAGDQIDVTAQLIDARTGTHVWAQTYEQLTARTSLISIQDDIAHRISSAVGDVPTGAVAKAELERMRNKPAAEPSSYECVLLAYQAFALTRRQFDGLARA